MDLRERIKTKLKEMDNKKTKIAIFDFDGTLVDTPLPDTGKIKYQEKTGKPWPYEGWWGRHESLDMNIFDMPVVPMVIKAYQQAKAQPDTIVVMLTGRMSKMAGDVKKILDAKGLSFDEYLYNRGGETGEAKIKDMGILLDKYPDVREIEMWDDRVLHIERFRQFGEDLIKSGRLTHFKVNHVNSDHHDPVNNC